MFNAEYTMVAGNVLLIMAIGSALIWRKDVKFNPFNKASIAPLRFILAVLVAISHLPTADWLNLGVTAVAVFFFISGYGMQKSYMYKGCIYLNGLISRYVLKLFGPFIICAIPWIIRMYIGSRYSDEYDYNIQFVLDCLRRGTLSAILPNSWYPFALLCFCAIFKVAYSQKNILYRHAVLGGGVIGYYVVCRYFLRYMPFWYATSWSFLLGCVYSGFEDQIMETIKKMRWKYPVVLLTLFLMFWCIKEFVPVCRDVPIVSETSRSMTGMIVITACYFYRLPSWRWIVALGGISYEYYLCHGEVGFVFEKLGCSNCNVVLFTLVASIPVAWFVHLIWGNILKLFTTYTRR